MIKLQCLFVLLHYIWGQYKTMTRPWHITGGRPPQLTVSSLPPPDDRRFLSETLADKGICSI